MQSTVYVHLTKLALATILAAGLLVGPSMAQAYSCAGKDGEYCHANEIYICDSGELVFIDGCLYGCNEGDGPNANCSPPPFCKGKANGKWCNGNKLTTCSGGSMTNETNCANGCGGSGPSAYCKSGFCAAKSDGEWCKSNEIYICDNGELVFIDGCLYGCQEGTGPNANCSPKPFCKGKANGKWCDGNKLITCSGGSQTNQKNCANGCGGSGPNAYCKSGFCATKADGEWCHADEIYICDNGELMFIDGCLYGCQEGTGPDANCSPKPTFCTGKANGGWCDGDKLVNCSNGLISKEQNCQYGCQGSGPGAACKQGGYCAGKADGEWCHAGEIYICDGGEDIFIDPCLSGCEEGTGPDANCNAPPGFCDVKADGMWCQGQKLVTCENGNSVNEKMCSSGCTGSGPNATCASAGFCEGKQDGYWCNDETGDLAYCINDLISDTVECPDTGCDHNDLGTDDECKEPGEDPVPTDYCDDQPDSAFCADYILVTCAAGDIVNTETCMSGCVNTGDTEPDHCNEPETPEVDPQFCVGQAGYFCYENLLVYCFGNVAADVEQCPTGCSQQDPGTPDLCDYEDPDSFCSHHGDGVWCNGYGDVVNCQGGTSTSSPECPSGCLKAPPGSPDVCPSPANCDPGLIGSPISVVVNANCCPTFSGAKSISGVPIFNQRDYDDDLGDCPGQTIETWGCMITAFSMWYKYLDLERTLGGDTLAPNPVNENKWRSKNNQGYACCEYNSEGDCKDVPGTCCAYWGTNPSGFGGTTPVENYPAEGCMLSVTVANSIAAELNVGSPLMAHMKSSKTSQHWVLVMGIDSSGTMLLNDPWNGVAGSEANSSDGLGPYTGVARILARGGIGGGSPEEPVNPDDPAYKTGPDDIEGPVGVTVLTEEGEQEYGFVVDDEDTDSASSCNLTSSSQPLGIVILLLVMLVALSGFTRVRTRQDP